MSRQQMVVTAVMAILMLGTILMMPAQVPGTAHVKRTGAVVTPAKIPAEFSQDAARRVSP